MAAVGCSLYAGMVYFLRLKHRRKMTDPDEVDNAGDAKSGEKNHGSDNS